MSYQRLVRPQPNAHETLVADVPILNLRRCVGIGGDTGKPVYQLSVYGGKTWRGVPQIKLTDMCTDYQYKETAILKLVENTPRRCRYRGSLDSEMGDHVEYDLQIRVDVSDDLRERQIRATTTLFTQTRRRGLAGRMFGKGLCHERNDYDIYSHWWEEQNRIIERPELPSH